MAIRLVTFIYLTSLVFSGYFQQTFSYVFTIPSSNWIFSLNKAQYSVDVAGYLKNKTWKNSPAIIFAEEIPAPGGFDFYLRQHIAYRKLHNRNLIVQKADFLPNLKSSHICFYWKLPAKVYEYETLFFSPKGNILALTLSSKTEEHLKEHLPSYETLLQNLGRSLEHQ